MLCVSAELWTSHRCFLVRVVCFLFCLGISIQTSVLVDPVTGLSTTSSTLQFSAQKEDTDAEFTCRSQHPVAEDLVSNPLTFTITCESLTALTERTLRTAPKAVCRQTVPRVILTQHKKLFQLHHHHRLWKVNTLYYTFLHNGCFFFSVIVFPCVLVSGMSYKPASGLL